MSHKPNMHCKKIMIAIEYDGRDPLHYDGVSEWKCSVCGKRFGRWSGKELKKGEQEKPYGR